MLLKKHNKFFHIIFPNDLSFWNIFLNLYTAKRYICFYKKNMFLSCNTFFFKKKKFVSSFKPPSFRRTDLKYLNLSTLQTSSLLKLLNKFPYLLCASFLQNHTLCIILFSK